MGTRRNDIPELSNLKGNSLENMFNVLTDADGRYYYDLTDTLYLETEDMNPLHYNEYDVRQNDTFYSISKKYYDTYNLWWVVALANDIDDPFALKDMVGDKIKVINRGVVGRILTFLGDV